MIYPDDSYYESQFMLINVPRFLKNYFMTYNKEDNCADYFISRTLSIERISYSLMISFDKPSNNLYIAKFHPELFRGNNSKYLSAAYLYLMIHHFAHMYFLDETCHITLNTNSLVFEKFYPRLKDFNSHILKNGLGGMVELNSDYRPLSVKTEIIKKLIFSKKTLFDLI